MKPYIQNISNIARKLSSSGSQITTCAASYYWQIDNSLVFGRQCSLLSAQPSLLLRKNRRCKRSCPDIYVVVPSLQPFHMCSSGKIHAAALTRRFLVNSSTFFGALNARFSDHLPGSLSGLLPSNLFSTQDKKSQDQCVNIPTRLAEKPADATAMDHKRRQSMNDINLKRKHNEVSPRSSSAPDDDSRVAKRKQESKLQDADSRAWLTECALLYRPWKLTEFGESFIGTDSSHKGYLQFTLATYNVLAQNLLEDNSYLYRHCRPEWLAWSYRQERLLAELIHHQPDSLLMDTVQILCCQEINAHHYEEFFSPVLGKLGYKGEFKKRTRSMLDGCAVFYKTSVFDCEMVVPLEYLKPGVAVLDRDNVALILLLRPKLVAASSARLVVANTHLLFNPRRGDVKLAQLMLLFAELDRLAYRSTVASSEMPVYYPIVFCGDLNLEPFSQLYRFVSSGTLPVNGVTVRKLSGQERNWNVGGDRTLPATFFDHRLGISDASQYISVCNERMQKSKASNCSVESGNNSEADVVFTQGSGTVTHRLGFRSVYRHYTECDGGQKYKHEEREVTTSHGSANCTVDYIFYSSGNADGDWMTDVDGGSASSSSRETVANRDLGCEASGSKTQTMNNFGTRSDPLQLLASLALMSENQMKKLGRLPNDVISSDHLILAAKFALKLK